MDGSAQNKIDKVLNSIYYTPDNPSGFASLDKLYSEAKKKIPNLTNADVRKWASSQLTYTLHKPVRKNYKRNRIIVNDIDEQWEADLVEMQEFSKANKGYRYILTIIDVFSKYAWGLPLKNKSGKELTEAFANLLKSRRPAAIRTDMGKEFVNAQVQKLLSNYGIRFYTSSNRDIKCAVIERFNRTLKSKMFKYFTAKGTRRYFDMLPSLIQGYNNSHHRAIKMSPAAVNEANKQLVFENLYGKKSLLELYLQPKNSSKLNENDQVRKVHKFNPFDKGFYPNWTDQTYKITKIDKGQKLPVYELTDQAGEVLKEKKFYDKELQKVTTNTHRVEKILKRRVYKGNVQYFVKWIGYSANYNSWINSEDLTTVE